MTDTSTEAALAMAETLNCEFFAPNSEDLNACISVDEARKAAAIIYALVAERDEALKRRQRQAMMTIAAEGQAMDNYERAEAAEARVKVLEEALRPALRCLEISVMSFPDVERRARAALEGK
jgi:hypothetical protein